MAIVGAPCPAAILTFGLLLMSTARVPRLLPIPFSWALSAVMPISVGMWSEIVSRNDSPSTGLSPVGSKNELHGRINTFPIAS